MLNVILKGPSASGKTWVACAIGMAACRRGYRVRYYKARNLVAELRVARKVIDGSYQRAISRLRKTQLLIIDDFLLHEVTSEEVGELLELVDARRIVGSTIFCSHYRHGGWIEIIGRSPVSKQFMSRVSSSSYVLRMDSSEDMRTLGSEII